MEFFHQIKEWWKVLKNFPPGLIGLYFVFSFYETLPIVAFGDWLFNTIKMSPSTTNIFNSVLMFPWHLKPLYALLSDYCPILGYRRKSYVFLCQVGVAICFYCTASFVKTVVMVFVVKSIQSTLEAFSQIMLGVALADFATENTNHCGQIQSIANSIKNMASLIAQLIGIPLYKGKSISSTSIIRWMSLFPMIGALISLFQLKEKRGLHVDWPTTFQRPQFNCQFLGNLRCKKLLLFLVVYSCMPKSSSTFYQYSYTLFENQMECLQYSSLVGTIARFVACLVYGIVFSDIPLKYTFVITSLFSSLSALPQILLVPPINDLGIGTCTLANLESALTSFSGELTLMPLLVIATEYATDGNQGIMYALFLSAIDLGNFISGFLSSFLVVSLNISVNQWENLTQLIFICSLVQLLPLLLMPFLLKQELPDCCTFMEYNEATPMVTKDESSKGHSNNQIEIPNIEE